MDRSTSTDALVNALVSVARALADDPTSNNINQMSAKMGSVLEVDPQLPGRVYEQRIMGRDYRLAHAVAYAEYKVTGSSDSLSRVRRIALLYMPSGYVMAWHMLRNADEENGRSLLADLSRRGHLISKRDLIMMRKGSRLLRVYNLLQITLKGFITALRDPTDERIRKEY